MSGQAPQEWLVVCTWAALGKPSRRQNTIGQKKAKDGRTLQSELSGPPENDKERAAGPVMSKEGVGAAEPLAADTLDYQALLTVRARDDST
jgi:hypothetical protein